MAIDKVALDCGGKRSATPLWLRVTLADESGNLSCLRKRRRASLAAALQSDFVNGPDLVRQSLATRGAGDEARIGEVLESDERRHKLLA